jgi:ADP-ribose diphosphatase
MVMDELAKLLDERVLSEGGRGRLRRVEYGFAGGVRQAFDVFDVRATMQGSAGVVAMDEAGHVHLVREFLPALGAWGLTIPRGGIEVGEAAEVAAARELKEEAGLVCAALVPLWEGVVLPNVSS